MSTLGTQNPRASEFEEILDKTIEKVMKDVLGDSGAAATNYMLKRSDVHSGRPAENLPAFENGMRTIFKEGWEIFARLIMDSIHEQTKLTLSAADSGSFSSAVSSLRTRFLKDNETKKEPMVSASPDMKRKAVTHLGFESHVLYRDSHFPNKVTTRIE